MGQSRHAMIVDELLAIRTPTVELDISNRAIGIGRSLGYRLAREGRYPCRVITVGTAHRVVTADLLRMLGLDGFPATRPANAEATR